MKWTNLNTKMYFSAKEYVDTAIIPLVPFEMDQNEHIEKSTYQSEYVNLLMLELEKELTGRLLLIPTYTYIKTNSYENEVERINGFVNEINNQPFNHLFFVTLDPKWKKYEKELKGDLIWLPSTQMESNDIKELRSMVENQMKQLKELIQVYW